MWKNLRLCLVHLYKLIRTQIWKGNALDPPLFMQEETEHHIFAAEQIIQEMAVGVCASVPQMTGMTAFPQIPNLPQQALLQ